MVEAVRCCRPAPRREDKNVEIDMMGDQIGTMETIDDRGLQMQMVYIRGRAACQERCMRVRVTYAYFKRRGDSMQEIRSYRLSFVTRTTQI